MFMSKLNVKEYILLQLISYSNMDIQYRSPSQLLWVDFWGTLRHRRQTQWLTWHPGCYWGYILGWDTAGGGWQEEATSPPVGLCLRTRPGLGWSYSYPWRLQQGERAWEVGGRREEGGEAEVSGFGGGGRTRLVGRKREQTLTVRHTDQPRHHAL